MQDLVDIRSKTVMKNECKTVMLSRCAALPSRLANLESITVADQKDKNRVDGGPVPAQHLLCPSRAPGSPYVQSSVYTVPDGYHGSGEQAGTMSHYECKQHESSGPSFAV